MTSPSRTPGFGLLRSARGLILALLLPMIAIVWIEVTKDALEHVETYADAERAIATNKVVDALVQGGQNLAFERGRANVVLNGKAPISPENRAFINARRAAATTALTEAQAGLPDALRLTFAAHLDRVADLRRQVDEALALPQAERPAGIAEAWVRTMSAMLAEIEGTVVDVSLNPAHYTPHFRILTRIKIHAFRLRSTLGLESSRLASGISSGVPLSAEALHDVARLRGESASTWDALKRESTMIRSADLAAAIAEVERLFFAGFRPQEDRVVTDILAGRPYPVTSKEFTSASVPALDSIAKIMDAAERETRAYGERRLDEAATALAVYTALAVATLILGLATIVVVATRVLSPLQRIRSNLTALSNGMLDIDIGPTTHLDEVGELQQAVLAFRKALMERRRIADELARQSERMTTMVNAIPDLVCFKDGDGAWLMVNDFGIELFGLAGADYYGKTDTELGELVPACRQSHANCVESDERAWRRGKPTRGEEIITGANGVPRFFDVVKVPLMAPDGGRRGLVVVGRDITERRRIEAALARLSRQNELILECAGEGIIGIDPDGTTVFINPAASRMTGWSIESLLGQNHHMLVHHTHSDGSPHPIEECPVRQTLADGIPRQVEDDVFWRRDGTPLPVEFMVTPMAEQGQVRGAVVVFRDIGERKRVAAEREMLLEDLRRSNGDLEQFAYAISHDLQEPLRMVASYVQLLRRRYQGKLDSDADEFISFAADGAARMSAMINGLLEYARVSSRGAAPTPVDTAFPLEHAVANLTIAIAESQAELVLPETMPTVIGDDNQLSSVFQNLIGNAIKYRAPDRAPLIVLSVERRGGRWLFALADNGIGIAAKNRDRAFGVFQRLEARPEVSGTGMGLAICKRIVERLGGRIWIEDNPDGGTRFVFTLPAAD